MADLIATRDGFGKELVKLGEENEKIVVVSADLEDATRADYFKKAFPDRFFTVGIAEQDMIGMAAGLSLQGFIVFTNSFAVFMTNRAYDMIRLDLCYNNCNVKVICSHAGVTVGEDGASAQCLEDLALMRVLPNMKVVCPVDSVEAAKATRVFANEFGPMYMRTSRAALPVLTAEGDIFEIGKATVMQKGSDATVIACGIMVSEALSAAEILKKDGITIKVVNMHTIKPIDEEMIIQSAKETGAIVTAEEHQMYGGLGSAVAEVVVKNCPVPMEMIAVNDTFGQSGSPQELLKYYHLKDIDIAEAVKRLVVKKL
ncbi:MAG: transketolase [Omnitrophica WOR_2 bacterium GWF2_38_59]|nr:MAG: transketolase [Omnitrophica WOR_2 bacterium GWF2_38_59]OGX48107.1 MAG: transketolase [Omnitrophica WOR_2 bacterium RIFOXYA2_FULL_38_17]OGX58443.1 MAG: transketolase [Omnitrophica WOR_2 bacterium RIFOXYB2_FULL_38_16]HBG62507.1 transketolase [Candidatus Omnitrophota bacterium]